MPLIREYRVVMPMTVDEFHRGREWHRVEKLKLDLEILQDHKKEQEGRCSLPYDENVILNETVPAIPFFHEQSDMPSLPGKHVVKQYGEIPEDVGFLRVLYSSIQAVFDVLATNLMQQTEVESWESFPNFCSISRNHYVQNGYKTVIEAVCLPGSLTNENALKLPEKILKKREVVVVDIAGDVAFEDYRDGKDPVLFKSSKTGRGPLKTGVWMNETKPIMTCYILVSIKCDLVGFGMSYILERKLHQGMLRAMMLHHRELYCFIDDWIDMSLEEIKEVERSVTIQLKEKGPGGDADAPQKKVVDGAGGQGEPKAASEDESLHSAAQSVAEQCFFTDAGWFRIICCSVFIGAVIFAIIMFRRSE